MGNAVKHTQRANAEMPSLVVELLEFGRAWRALFDPYRPERHYMRGPGPKWHAKHEAHHLFAEIAIDYTLHPGSRQSSVCQIRLSPRAALWVLKLLPGRKSSTNNRTDSDVLAEADNGFKAKLVAQVRETASLTR